MADVYDLRKLFDTIDRNGDGQLDTEELQTVLARHMKLHFSLSSVSKMIRIHDTDNNGSISYAEFEKLHAFIVNMQKSFHYFDRDRSGELCRSEVIQALRHSGFSLDGPAFEALFKAFDPDRNNSLGMAEYIALAVFLRSASATFAAFDLQSQGQITLDFNQWIYACANVA